MQIVQILKRNKFTYCVGHIIAAIVRGIILDNIDLLFVYLRKYNIVSNTRYSRMKSMKDTHKGERCFILATGPSLTMEDLELLKNEYTMGVNSLVKVLDKLSYTPNSLGIQDKFVYEKLKDDFARAKIPYIFIWDKIFKDCPNRNDSKYIVFPKYHSHHAFWDLIGKKSTGFSSDCSVIVYDGYTITYSLIQIAVYMGFKEIYLLGCDCSYSATGKQHFVEYGHVDKRAVSSTERLIYAYEEAKKYINKYHPDVKIYNATRGGKLEVFERKALEEVLGRNN